VGIAQIIGDFINAIDPERASLIELDQDL